MTKVICAVTRSDGPLYFECDGHSDYRNKKGYNDVCAEVSTLCCMLVRYIDLKGYVPIICKNGHVKIELEHSDMRINEVFIAAMLEFSALEERFPEHIKVY